MHPFSSPYLDPRIVRTCWLLRIHSLPINSLSGLATALPCDVNFSSVIVIWGYRQPILWRFCHLAERRFYRPTTVLDWVHGVYIFSPYPQCTPLSRAYRNIHDSANVYVIIQPWFPISLDSYGGPRLTPGRYSGPGSPSNRKPSFQLPPFKPHKNNPHIPLRSWCTVSPHYLEREIGAQEGGDVHRGSRLTRIDGDCSNPPFWILYLPLSVNPKKMDMKINTNQSIYIQGRGISMLARTAYLLKFPATYYFVGY